ncbi:MAG: hypothetical protein JSR62_01705 [Nitrospira sp.]|nr:hypothetical protein [Nitrospira sp.]
MRRLIIFTAFTISLSFPASGLFAASDGDLRKSDTGASCNGLMPEQLLCDWYHQAIATLRDHIEIHGRLPADSSTGQRSGAFTFKFFPQGKSRSQEHVSAEGSFNLSPETDQPELTLRFKSSKRFHQFDDVQNQDTI